MNKVNITLGGLNYRTEEELKILRTNLLFCGVEKKVILITSTIPGEGKTETSMNLAVSLAKLNRKVLLLDLDLRKSVLESRYGVEEVKFGMSHFLSGQCQLGEVINSTNIPRLHLAVAGPATPNPTELLSGERFKKMIESLREVYDYVIIDSAPLGLVIDAAIVAKECDGTIVVVEAGKIRYRSVQDVKEKIESSGCPVLGAVLSKVAMKGSSHSKYHRYGKYGKYGRYSKYTKYDGYYSNFKES